MSRKRCTPDCQWCGICGIPHPPPSLPMADTVDEKKFRSEIESQFWRDCVIAAVHASPHDDRPSMYVVCEFADLFLQQYRKRL